MTRRCILGVFAHPDDETSAAGGTFTRFVRECVDVYVVIATRGELGTLGTGGQAILREELPTVREAELRAVLQMYGAHPPIILAYRDQGLKDADFHELVEKVIAVMERVRPDVVITFGPKGIDNHDDHVALHKATVEAYRQYCLLTSTEPKLFYPAIPKYLADKYDLGLDGPEVEPTVFIDIKEYKPIKIQALRMYRSQKDAQWLADLFEQSPFNVEAFHQAYPTVPCDHLVASFWE